MRGPSGMIIMKSTMCVNCTAARTNSRRVSGHVRRKEAVRSAGSPPSNILISSGEHKRPVKRGEQDRTSFIGEPEAEHCSRLNKASGRRKPAGTGCRRRQEVVPAGLCRPLARSGNCLADFAPQSSLQHVQVFVNLAQDDFGVELQAVVETAMDFGEA